VAAIDSPTIAICDAGPLIHLDELGSVDLLTEFGEILIPEQVCVEVTRHRPRALERILLPWSRQSVEISRSPNFQALMAAFSLGLGEQAALTLMQSRPEAIFLSDDAAARMVAKSLRLRSQGTIGLLLRAIRLGQRSQEEILNLLHEIPGRSTLHIRESLLRSVIEEVETGGAATA
jgi:predicted nucleic acid-binding protein